jgi:hypothetical protein
MTASTGQRRMLAVIPAYNEQGAIRRVVAGARDALPEADILVVDDGSSDRTAEEAEAAGAIVVRQPFNLGIGATVQTGLRFACEEGYDLVCRLDGDGQHDPADLPLLIAALVENRVDAVFGSRFLGHDPAMPIPPARRLGIGCFRMLVTLLTGQRVTDTTSGFCCLSRRAAEVLARYLPQDYPEVESRVVLHKAGLIAMEIPVQMRPRTTGVSSIDGWRSIYYAFKVSLAVLITGIKDIAPVSERSSYGHTVRTATHRYPLQPQLGGGDRPADPPA